MRKIDYQGNSIIGRGINSGESAVGSRTNARTILKPDGKGSFDIITSYPIK